MHAAGVDEEGGAPMDALLLIDLQEDFFEPPGLAGERRRVVEAVLRWVEQARRVDARIIEIRTELPEDESTWALNMRDDRQPVALEGTPGAQGLAELGHLALPVIVKRRDDAFVGTDLALRLRALGAERLVIAGVSTEACIALTAAGAYARDFRVALAGGAIASADPDAHDRSIAWLAAQYRQPVMSLPKDC